MLWQPTSFASEVGIASYYGHKLYQHRTASGELFNPALLTAAHHTLPLGTYVRVTSLTTHRCVIVRINDRGLFWRYGKIIDLSEGAAIRLGIDRKKGIDRVRLQVVKKPRNVMRGL